MTYVRRDMVDNGMFGALHERSRFFKEKNDCSVKALAVVCGVTYDVAHETMAKFGRRHGCGAQYGSIHKAVRHLGFDCPYDPNFKEDRLDILCNEKNYVVKNLTTRQLTLFPELAQGGTWLLHTNGHVVAVKDGKVHCWGAKQALRIKAVYKVIG